MEYFVFPFKFEDLLEETSDSRYRIQQSESIVELDEKRLKKRLEEIDKTLYKTYSEIKQSDIFDFLYYLIRNFEKKIEKYSIDVIEQVPELLSAALENLLKQIVAEQSKSSNDLATLEIMRTSLKMILFLVLYFLNSTCIKKSKNSLKDELNDAQRENKPNSKRRQGGMRKDISNELSEKIVERQVGCLRYLAKAASIKFQFLWGKKQVDERFYSHFTETGLKMLESKLLMKSQQARDSIFLILENILTDNVDFFNKNVLQMINLIFHEDDSLVEHISDFLIRSYKCSKPNMTKFTSETLRALVNFILEKTNVNTESNAVKNTKEILCRVSKEIPKFFQLNLNNFLGLFSSEAYLLRNALCEIISNIVLNHLSKVATDGEDLDQQENQQKQKRKLLDQLIGRVYDKHAFARSHILSLWNELCENDAVPKEYLAELLKYACDRLKDVSAHVRRKSIQLLQSVIQIYFRIFVPSNKKHFLTKPEIIKEIDTSKTEKQELTLSIKKVTELLGNFIEETDDYLELQNELNGLNKRFEENNKIIILLEEYKVLITIIESIIPNLVQLLGSKNVGDVLESIKLLFIMKTVGVDSSDEGLRKMLALVWSKEKSVKEELIRTYWTLYMNEEQFSSEQIARNIIGVFNSSSLTELTSLEQLICLLLDNESQLDEREKRKEYFQIGIAVFKKLWEIFLYGLQANGYDMGLQLKEKYQKIEKQSMRSALQILRIAYTQDKDLLVDKQETLLQILNNFQRVSKPDWIVVKEISIILEKTAENNSNTDQMIKCLIYLLIKHHGTYDSEWYCAAEQVLNTVFVITKRPENIAEYLILKCSKFIFTNAPPTKQIEYPKSPSQQQQGYLDVEIIEKSPRVFEEAKSPMPYETEEKSGQEYEEKLTQLLFVVGHVAIKFIFYIDVIENELKRQKLEAESKEQARKDNDEEDLDKIHGGTEAYYEKGIEELHKTGETCLVYKNLLSFYAPLIKNICSKIIEKKGLDNKMLERVAVLSLCKYMCCSEDFCSENLNKLFALLGTKTDPITKTNIIISLGDLIHRYPNITEPYTQALYQNLKDDDVSVRRTTLMVITHLILNDMLKIKGEICEIALLFEDSDPKIQNLCKLFFHELHKKDAKLIYNLLPEAIGRMSRHDNGISEAMFQNFIKNIIQFLEKEKNTETLVDKLCQRFKNSTENLKECRNIAFTISQLQLIDKSLRRLLDSFEIFRASLVDVHIMDSFRELVKRLKKAQKNEIKQQIEELENILNNHMKNIPQEEKKRKVPERKQQVNENSNNTVQSNHSIKRIKGTKQNNNKNTKSKNNKKQKFNDFIADEQDDEEIEFYDEADDIFNESLMQVEDHSKKSQSLMSQQQDESSRRRQPQRNTKNQQKNIGYSETPPRKHNKENFGQNIEEEENSDENYY